MREPKMAACDFWFRLYHLARRYGDRTGVILFLKKALGLSGGWKKIWTYDMPEQDFFIMDTMEIRGAILHRTPTKKHGGINSARLNNTVREVFGNTTIYPFGLFASIIEFFSILFQKKPPLLFANTATKIDSFIARFVPFLPFESFSIICKKRYHRV